MNDPEILRRLERMEASIAIQQLPVRYAMAVDCRNMDDLADLYVDDIDFGQLGKGREALKIYFTAATSAFYRSVHQIMGHKFDFLDDEHAVGQVYCRADHERGDTWIVAQMCYFDKYIRRDGKWYFADKRDFDFYYCADSLEHPQDVGFQRFVVPGMKLDVPMMIERFPSWKVFWDRQGMEAVARLTTQPGAKPV